MFLALPTLGKREIAALKMDPLPPPHTGLRELNCWNTAPGVSGNPDGTVADQYFCFCCSGTVWHCSGQRDHGSSGLDRQPRGHEGTAGKNGGGQWQKWAARDSRGFGECVRLMSSGELAVALSCVQENGDFLTSVCPGNPRPCPHSRFLLTSLFVLQHLECAHPWLQPKPVTFIS